jgi:serine/threonine protein kinase
VTTSQPKRQPIPFGKYLLLDRINIGGMAEVWRGKTFGAGGFERLVAIKRILPNIAEDEEFITMFIDEAKISVQLAHANIAQIYELGHISNSYFIAMEYIPGKDMRAIFDRCRKKGEPAPIPLVAYCVSKMCEGLDYAHRKKDQMGRDLNIVHRDISPQNILVSYEGEVKVIDFGIAKAAGKATKTQAGILKGKFGYMSPEQIRGLPLDRRSDVFAIGVCLYEMLTGERLFIGESDFSVLEKVRKAEVAPPSTYNRKIPEQLEKIVLKALAKDVDERYQYASELGDDLQRFLITNDSLFGRKDLMQYMKATFAEDVEREKQRLADYATIKPPEGMMSAIEAGFSGSSPMSLPAPAPAPAPAQPSLESVVREEPQGGATAIMSPNVPGSDAIRRTPSLTALPKLTAAAATPTPKDDEAAATMLVDSSEYFDENDEPRTQPGVNRTVTPQESEQVGLGDGDAPVTGKTAVIGPPSAVAGASAQPHRPSSTNIPVVTPTPNIQVRPSVFGMAAINAQADAPVVPNRTSSPGRVPAADGLPRIVRPEPPAGGPPMLSPAGSNSSPPGPGMRPLPPVSPLAPTTPMTAPVGGRQSQGRDTKDTQPPRPVKPEGPNRMVLFGAMGGGVLLLLAVVGFLLTRPAPMGFIMVELPPELAGKAKVLINAQPVSVSNNVVLEPVPAGQVMVAISAEGYETFTETVTVREGKAVERVDAKTKMVALVKSISMVLATVPQDAEVKLNGKVIRAQGSQDAFIKDLPASDEMVVEVKAAGFKPFQQKYKPPAGPEPIQVMVKLEPE